MAFMPSPGRRRCLSSPSSSPTTSTSRLTAAFIPTAAGADLRPCPERAAPDARGRAGNGADRRRCAFHVWGALSVPRRGRGRRRGPRGAGAVRARGRRPRPCFEGVRRLQHSWKVFHRDPDAQLPDREHGLGGGARGRPHSSSPSIYTVGPGMPSGTTTAASRRRGRLHRRRGRPGLLGDYRFGLSRVIAAASVVYAGLGLVLGGFGNEWQRGTCP